MEIFYSIAMIILKRERLQQTVFLHYYCELLEGVIAAVINNQMKALVIYSLLLQLHLF